MNGGFLLKLYLYTHRLRYYSTLRIKFRRIKGTTVFNDIITTTDLPISCYVDFWVYEMTACLREYSLTEKGRI